MNVLISQAGLETTGCRLSTNGLQALHQLLSLPIRDHSDAGEHPGMGDRPIEILLKKGQIKTDRGVERLNEGMQTLLKTIAPGACCTTGHPTSHQFIRRFPQLVRRLTVPAHSAT